MRIRYVNRYTRGVLLLRSASSNLIHRLLEGVGMDWKELRLLFVVVLLREGITR